MPTMAASSGPTRTSGATRTSGVTRTNSGPVHNLHRTVRQSLDNTNQPSVPDQNDFYIRTQSFKNWPRRRGVKVSDLVNSGFSYLGTLDRVRCFQCGVIFDGWREGEDVDSKHARLSPHCTFIVTRLERTMPPPVTAYEPREFHVTNSGEKYTLPKEHLRGQHLDYTHVVNVPQQHAPKNRFPVAPRDIRARLDIASSRKLLDMGYKKTLLAQVIGERLSETGDDFRTFMEYFMAVKNAEQILGGGEVDTMKSFYDKKVQRLSNPASLIQCHEPEPVTAAAPSSPVQPPSSTASAASGSDNSLKRKKECNICMDAEADTVFMPCRHMCACATCADKMENCPICRKPIEHCIKVFV